MLYLHFPEFNIKMSKPVAPAEKEKLLHGEQTEYKVVPPERCFRFKSYCSRILDLEFFIFTVVPLRPSSRLFPTSVNGSDRHTGFLCVPGSTHIHPNATRSGLTWSHSWAGFCA